MKRKNWTVVAGIVILGIGSLGFVWIIRRMPATPIAASGGMSSEIRFEDAPFYLQTDARWAHDRLGNTGASLASEGCTVCSLSMALAYYGVDLTPKALNVALTEKGGYTDKGWLIWKRVSEVTDDQIEVGVPRQAKHALIDEALQARQPVLAKVMLNAIVPHWVLIVGKSGGDYLMKDPLGNGMSLEKLSKYQSDIYAIRIVQPKSRH
ncbi:MAG: hypothetical protein KDC35_16030 [Acidobacteria bacterium]|nr:hypothetical protein [Acidobacteriota bacterium]